MDRLGFFSSLFFITFLSVPFFFVPSSFLLDCCVVSYTRTRASDGKSHGIRGRQLFNQPFFTPSLLDARPTLASCRFIIKDFALSHSRSLFLAHTSTRLITTILRGKSLCTTLFLVHWVVIDGSASLIRHVVHLPSNEVITVTAQTSPPISAQILTTTTIPSSKKNQSTYFFHFVFNNNNKKYVYRTCTMYRKKDPCLMAKQTIVQRPGIPLASVGRDARSIQSNKWSTSRFIILSCLELDSY